ncbi:MAG: AAA family ATPase [Lachnospiraceae bacterium]|nr:AAA family ATPase [Lachnospiraceae bacterium]
MEKEGYRFVEEHIGDCINFFLRLQGFQEESGNGAFAEEIRRIKEREQATRIFLPAKHLRECYGLGRTEYWLVMFAFCCEVEEGLCLAFREKYHEKWPSLQYALHLLSVVLPVDFGLVGKLCGTKGALGGLLNLCREGTGDGGCLARPLLLERAPLYFLLTGRVAEEDWYTLFLAQEPECGEEVKAPPVAGGQGNLAQNAPPPCGKYLPIHEKERALLVRYLEGREPLRILLHGGRGCGKHKVLRRACEEAGRNLVFVRLPRLQGYGEREMGQAVRTLRFLLKMLAPVAALELYRTNDASAQSAPDAEREAKLPMMFAEEFPDGKLVFLTEHMQELFFWEEISDMKLFLSETLSQGERKIALDAWIWKENRQEWQEELLGRFHMNIGELARSCKALRVRAAAENIPLKRKELWEEVLFCGAGKGGLGQLVEKRAGLDEIVLAPECRKQLETVLKIAKAWTGRQGLQLLFHGSSGTGKTMAASILAKELARPLYKVDLSQIFDKFIGETEKHIDEIFRAAERGSYVLFFDEADALFAKRTGIKDSHDRYANVSTAYLLQRMEDYRGVLVLATNLIGHFDDAFVRRIRFVIRFRKPDEKGRELLWEKALSGEIPVSGDLSYAELARAAELSPARICSAAQVAKLLAACKEASPYGAGSCITREIIREALELEAGKDETRLQFAGGYSDGEGL